MDDRILMAEANQHDWSRLHMSVRGGSCFKNENAEWSVNPRPSGGNIVIAKSFSESGSAIEDEIETILQTYQAAGLSATWDMGPTCTPPNLPKILRARHLMGPTFLHLHWIDLQRRTAECDYPVEAIDWSNPSDCRHPLVEWIAKSKRADFLELQRELAELATSTLSHIAIRVGGDFAACACIYLTGEVAGIYAVVVLKEMRGKGLGSAITLAAINHARELGARFATLQCLRRTSPFYERLGFEVLGTMSSMYYSKERSKRDWAAKQALPS